jgi:hypothetical protein
VERTALAGGHFSHVIVISHANHYGVLMLCGCSGRQGDLAAVFALPGFSAGRGAVKDGDGVSRARQVAGHGVAHGTQSDESDAVW